MLGTKVLWLNPVFSLSNERPILLENPVGFCGLCIASINIDKNVSETCYGQSELFLTCVSAFGDNGQAQRRRGAERDRVNQGSTAVRMSWPLFQHLGLRCRGQGNDEVRCRIIERSNDRQRIEDRKDVKRVT